MSTAVSRHARCSILWWMLCGTVWRLAAGVTQLRPFEGLQTDMKAFAPGCWRPSTWIIRMIDWGFTNVIHRVVLKPITPDKISVASSQALKTGLLCQAGCRTIGL